MFKRLKQTMNIDKAFLIWEQEGIYLKNLFDKFPWSERAYLREEMRKMQDQGFEIQDLAVMLITPFLSAFPQERREELGGIVFRWLMDKRIQTEVHDYFRNELKKLS